MILVMTIGYAPPDFVREGVEYFLERSDPTEYDAYTLVDPGFPVGGEKENRDKLRVLAAEKGLQYLAIENLGCHKNWDFTARHYGLSDHDILVGVCPDARGEHKGWVKAGVDVLRAEPECFTVQLNRYGDYTPYNPYYEVRGGQQVVRFPRLVAWSVGMFNMGLVNSVGGFDAYNPYYGYGEHWLVDRLVPKGNWWCFLRDFYDRGAVSPDPAYTRWKELAAAGVWKESFEAWLLAGKPG